MKYKIFLGDSNQIQDAFIQIDNKVFAVQEILYSNDKIILTLDSNVAIPEDVLILWNDWQDIREDTIGLYKTNYDEEVLECNLNDIKRNNLNKNVNSNSHFAKEIENHVNAYNFILNLLLFSKEISINSSKEKLAIDILKNALFRRSIWLRYYLLGDQDILHNFGFKIPQNREYKPGKVEAKQYDYIEELFEHARDSQQDSNLSHKGFLCNWLLTYSSPAQIWFGLQVNHWKKEWRKKTISEAIKSKDRIFQEEKEVLDKLKILPEEDEKLLYLYESNEDLSFEEAFIFTQVRFEQQYGPSTSYFDFIKARQEKNYYIRKGGSDVQILKTNKCGNLSFGKLVVDSYCSKTGILILRSNKKIKDS